MSTGTAARATFLCAAILALVLGVTGSRAAPSSTAEGKVPRTANDILNLILPALDLSLSDLQLRDDYFPPDPARLTVVSRLLADPRTAFQYSRTTFLEPSASSNGVVLALAGELIDLKMTSAGRRYEKGDSLFSAALAAHRMRFGGSGVHSENLEDAVPLHLQESVSVLLLSMMDALNELDRAFEELSDEESSWLLAGGKKLILDETLTDREEASLASRTVEIGSKIDLERCLGVAHSLSAAVQSELPVIKGAGVQWSRLLVESGLFPIRLGTSGHGEVLILGPGDDLIQGDPIMVVDFGGNDRYELDEITRSPHARLILDLEGNDQYGSGCGSGVVGVEVLIDLDGNDWYLADEFATGCGFAGVGLVDDRSGDDRYSGKKFVQGAGFYGLGVLRDREGDDVYSSGYASQGFGSVRGAGLLLDQVGNDRYLAGGLVKDHREEGAFTCMSQGVGFGFRDSASGGAGVLVDGSGDDLYQGDYFSQGSGYWFGFGWLFDGSGNDRYLARRYSQGAATHFAAGMFFDRNGDDVYQSWGVSQGCGHDWALGFFQDSDGHDRYLSEWLSQGAGSANGVGLFVDHAGDDFYYAGKNTNQGYGNRERDLDSIGVFVDLAGFDRYWGAGSDSGFWTRGERGGGVDRASSNEPPIDPGE